MKKAIALLCVLLITAGFVWWFVMDPVSVDRADVAVIELHEYDRDLIGSYEESIFQITDENHIHYITDFLNKLLPIPGSPDTYDRCDILVLLDSQGHVIQSITLHMDYFATDKGSFQADMGELMGNLNNIKRGEDLRVSMAAFGIILICWLFMIVLMALAGLILFLIQMTVCYKTDSLALRLLPLEIILLFIFMGYHTRILTTLFYWVSSISLDSTYLGPTLLGGVTGLCLLLGWRQGDSARKSKAVS